MLSQQKLQKMRSNHNSLNKQRGVVIVVALFIVALVATLAYVMMNRLERDTWRTQLILRTVEAEAYAQGSIAWAKDQLRTNWEKQKATRLVDQVPIKSEPVKVNGYKIASTIYDMQARFNINNMITPNAQNSFLRLLKVLAPELDGDKARALVMAIVDWISPAAQETDLAQYYANLPEPYRAAHRSMLDINELRLVKGMTAKLFNRLRPYIAALPSTDTKINLQTASLPVLVTISPKLKLEVAKALIKYREEHPIVKLEKFFKSDFAKKYALNSQDLPAVDVSDYFLVETMVAIEDQHIVLYSLLERATKKNGSRPIATLLWQSKGSW